MVSMTDFGISYGYCVQMTSTVFYVVDMNIKQTKNIFIVVALFAASLFGTQFFTETAAAYKCVGQTAGGVDYYYKDGRCWEPHFDRTNAQYDTKQASSNGGCPAGYQKIGNTNNCQAYLCNGNVQQDNTCWQRNESKDKPGGPAPVHDDGSAVTDWKCSNGAKPEDDCKKTECTLTGSGNSQTCTTDQGHKVPAQDNDPKAANATPNPNSPNSPQVNNYCTQNYANDAQLRQACTSGRGGFPCDNMSGAQKAACEAGKQNGTAQANQMAKQSGDCGGAKTNIVSCQGSGAAAIGDVLKQAIIVLTAIIGVVATGGIVYAAILYASAQDNASQVSKAKTIMVDVAIGLFLYGFMVAIINWLVPGGIIS